MNTYRRIQADPADYFAAEEVKKAKDYQRPLTVARAISLVLNAGLIVAVISTDAAPRLADAAGIDAWPLRLLFVLILLTLALTIIDLPISIWTTFSHERKWEFSTETPGGFVGDEVKGFVLGIVLQGALFLTLWWLIQTTELWWLAGWAAFFLFSVVLAFLFPIVIMPIFNKFTPLEDEGLATRLRALAEGVGMRISGVQVMDASKRTRKDNAFFAGLGGSRRIVIFDNLLSQPADVIASIVAHELGHWRRRHVAKGIVLGTVTSLSLFVVLRFVASWDAALDWAGVSSVRDPAALPLVLLVFAPVSSAIGIVQAWISRAHERQADIDALEITNDREAFAETHRGLSTRNLIDLAPSWWRYVRASHPPPAERLRLADEWRPSERSKVS
ncbi:MAG: M48 family metallopeptidase [Actinomycetota bacterium]